MADATPIEWTDASWNPLRARNTATGKVGWFCVHVSEGCRNCYAEGFNRRLGTKVDYKPQVLKAGEVELFLDPVMLTQPLRWKKPRMIFVCSMTDLFADFVTDDQLDQIFAVMALCPRHTFQILTKRPERMRDYLRGLYCGGAERWLSTTIDLGDGPAMFFDLVEGGFLETPLANVWLGVSVEDQPRADERIPVLLDTPAAVRWISAEPLLGPVNLNHLPWAHGVQALVDAFAGVWVDSRGRSDWVGKIDWVVAGGESGPGARPMHPDWARQLRDQCAAAGVPFLFKQWGAFRPTEPGDDVDGPYSMAWPDGHVGGGAATLNGGPGTSLSLVGKKAAGRLLDGVLHDAFPEAR